MAFNLKGLADIFSNPKTLNLVKMGIQTITGEINKAATDMIDRRLQNLNKKNIATKQNPKSNNMTLQEEIAFVEANYSKEDVAAWKKSKGL